MKFMQLGVLAYVFLCSAMPPDKVVALHIIKTRSIDLNSAHSLAMETRLEKTIAPTLYKVALETDLDDNRFKGRVDINLTWLEESETINLHCAHELEITTYSVLVHVPEEGDLEEVQVTETSMDLKKPILTIRLEKRIPKNTEGVLILSYKGMLETASTEAFFKTTYITEQETERTVFATQLRPNNARRVFPCFDEPAFKTPFELNVVQPRNLSSISNMPVLRTQNMINEPDSIRVYFGRTPPMSTFSLGLIIADLKQYNEAIKFTDKNRKTIVIRIWGRAEYFPALEGVSDKVKRVFNEITSFWQISLPLEKIDIVALPNYQGVKPADNWGLIVFKESDLSNRGYIQLAQELTYQWLGAYTTPAWWSDAHLNKALVGYLAAEIAFKINGGTEMEGKWPMTMLYSLYYEYSKRYPHSRITGMKQETTSMKIELLFRMFNFTLGRNTFRQGLQKFMESKKLKTFTGDDIWNALNESAQEHGRLPQGVDVRTLATSWIAKDRLPLVTVARNYQDRTALVNQKVYLRERPHDVPDTDRMKWWIPVVVAREDNLVFSHTTPTTWTNQDSTLNNMPEANRFIIVNPEEIAPFPVNYDQHNWNLLSVFLQSQNRTEIPELTRAKLLHDAWNLAYAGELSFATAFNMTLFLKNERHPLVWDPVFTMIDLLEKHICHCIVDKFRAYVRILLSPLYKELAAEVKEDEGNCKSKLLSHTKMFLCQSGYAPCIHEAQEQFKNWMEAPNPDEGNPISNQYICPVFKWGTEKEWNFGLQRVINFPPSRKQSERTYLLKTLAGCPLCHKKITTLLNVTLLEGNSNFTENDLFLIFSMLSSHSQGYLTLFQFLNNNWDTLKEKFISKTNIWDSLISSATSQFKTKDDLDEVSKFFVSHKGEFGSATHIIEKSLKNIREEAKWTETNSPIMAKWLGDYLETVPKGEDLFIMD